MENKCKEDESGSSSTGVFELPGEPAIVINGLPPMSHSDGRVVPCDIVSDADLHRNTGFGDWLEGREVQKLFGEQFYNGKVIEFDKETGWYRVVYEDGDFEDLEWHELKEVLLPLDITVPLKTLAMKIMKKRQKPVQRFRKPMAKSGNYRAKCVGGKEKTVEVFEEASSTMFNISQKTSENVQHWRINA